MLPAAKPDGEPLPEGLLWLLLTGKVGGGLRCDLISCKAFQKCYILFSFLFLILKFGLYHHDSVLFTFLCMLGTEQRAGPWLVQGIERSGHCPRSVPYIPLELYIICVVECA